MNLASLADDNGTAAVEAAGYAAGIEPIISEYMVGGSQHDVNARGRRRWRQMSC